MPARLGPNVGYYPSDNDAEEVVRIAEVPGAHLTETQRAASAPPALPAPAQVRHNLDPTPALKTYLLASKLNPPPSVQPKARLPLYATKRNSNSEYGAYKADRPPANVAPPLNIDLGLMEICTFLPDWLIIPEVLIRVMRNGADARLLAKIELYAIGQLDILTFDRRRNSLVKQMSNQGKPRFGVPVDWVWSIEYAREAGPENDLTANGWRNPTNQPWGAWKLNDIASHVPRENWPKGEDRLLFTQCLEFAALFPEKDLDTSHIPCIVQTLGLQAPAGPANENRDQVAVEQCGIAEPVR